MVKKVVVASGKRKTAIARAVVRPGKGRVWINGVPIEIFPHELARLMIMEPLILAGERVKEVDIKVGIRGGGVMGQAEAARTAISKALVQFFEDPQLEETYRSYDRYLLVSDPRRKLPKTPLGRGARKRRQTSYR